MIELRITSSDLQTLRSTLLSHNREQCAVLFATRGLRSTGHALLMVREIEVPLENDYVYSGVGSAQLHAKFVARIAKRARLNNLSLVFVHTHIGDSIPEFSEIDDSGEKELADFLKRREQRCIHAAMVLSRGGICARRLGHKQPIKVVSVGSRRIVEYDAFAKVASDFKVYDRQIRAFGIGGQRTLRNLCIAVVGLGGTGSVALQQLVHLGVKKLLLIDPDSIELTNLNRVVGATIHDIGDSKCNVAARYVKKFEPEAEVRSIVADVTTESVARNLIDADLIVCCTDSHGSRSVIQQVAYQYFISCIDVGSIITTKKGQVTGIFGRIQLIGPDQACLWCSKLLNPDQIRRDMMDESERLADPYFNDVGVEAPAVISLNATVVSLAITLMLGLVTPIPILDRYLIYDAKKSRLRSVSATAERDCFICSRTGVFGMGDSQSLFCRKA